MLLGKIATTSPTISVRGRNLALQVCATMELKLNRRDVQAAFLQSQESETGILDKTVPKLRKAMALLRNEIVQRRKSASVLCSAPKSGLMR